GLDLMVLQSAMLGASNHRQGIADIKFAHQVCVELETGDFELGCGRPVANVEGLHRVPFAQAKPLHGTMGDPEQGSEIQIVPVAQQQTITRHQADKMLKRSLDSVQAVENIGMIEFKIVNDGNLRQVMDELAAFVEKRCVVFVTLDNEPLA